jgi:hypothetical protein
MDVAMAGIAQIAQKVGNQFQIRAAIPWPRWARTGYDSGELPIASLAYHGKAIW